MRRLAQLRRLLQARSGLEPDGDRPDQLGHPGRSGRASTPGHGNGSEERVATLAYSLTPEALTLTVRDEAGWLAAAHSAAESALAAGPFDEVIRDEAGRSLTLVKRCGRPEGSP